MICKLCNYEKDISEYYSSNKTVCKLCVRARAKKWRVEHHEQWKLLRARSKKRWYATHKEHASEYYKRWYRLNGRRRNDYPLDNNDAL